MTRLRLALTLAGAVSLGAYEGGALAALVHALRPLLAGDDPPVRIDAIGGASAGAMTALLAARSVLEGLDPVEVMEAAWVNADSLNGMRSHDTAAPLSIEAARALAVGMLDPAGPRSPLRQRHPVRLSVVAACLRGLEHQIPALAADPPVRASTYLDVFEATMTAGQSVESLLSPRGRSLVDMILASGANPVGFPPVLIDLTEACDAYVDEAHITNLPPSLALWYTDGGTLDNEPLGRTLDVVNEIDVDDGGDFQRVHLLIHPHPTGAPAGDAWADPRREPTWLETLMRSGSLRRAQSLFADLEAVEKTNSRLAWTGLLVERLGGALADLEPAGRGAVLDALDRVVRTIDGHGAALLAGRTDAATAAAAMPATAEARPDATATAIVELLDRAVRAAAGLGGKRPSSVEVISPLVLAESETTPVQDMLAGDFLLHFGGFMDEALRRSDFDLGYQSTLTWLDEGGLARHGLSDADNTTARAAARDAYRPGEGWRRYGRSTFGSLSLLDKLQVARLVAHMNRVIGHDLLEGRTQR